MNESADASPTRPGWLRRTAVLLVGAILVVAGITLMILTSGAASASFGWFAYAPLSEAILIAATPIWQQPSFLGLVLSIVGLLMISADVGYRAGRRRGPAE